MLHRRTASRKAAVAICAVFLPNAAVYAIDDFPGYSPTTNDLFTTFDNAGGQVVRNTSPTFVGNGLDFSGIGYGVLSELFSRAYISPVHVASAGHTTTFISDFYVAPAAGGTGIKLSSGNTTLLNTGYDATIGAMTGAHIGPNFGVTTYAILDLPNAADYDERTVFEVGHGDSDHTRSPRVAVTTISSVSGAYFNTRRPGAPLQGGDSGGPTFTAWTNPLGGQELTFLGTHYGTDFSGNTVNGSNFFANTATIDAANNKLRKDSNGVDIPNSAMVHQGFAVRLAGVAATAWTGGASSDFATAGNWSNGGPISTNYVAFNGASTAQRGVDLGGASRAMRGLQFGPGAAGEGFTFSNGTLQLGRGGIVNYSSGKQTFGSSLGVTLADHQYWDAINADLQVDGAVDLNGKLLVVQGNHDTTLSGVVSDSAATSVGFTKYGLGSLTLTQPATYAGKTWVYGGTLRFDGAGALPAATPLAIANNSTARLELDGRQLTVSSLNSVAGPAGQYGTIHLGSGGRLTLDQPVNVDAAFSGAIAGGTNAATSVVLRGPTGSNIEFNLGGPSTFAGQMRVERGNLFVSHVNALGSTGTGNETIVVTDDTTAPAVRFTAQGTLGESLVLLNNSTATTGTLGSSATFTSPNLTLTAPITLARNASVAGRAMSWTMQSVNSNGVVADVKFGPITGRLESGAAAGAGTLIFNLYQDSKFTIDGPISNGTLSTLGVTWRGDGTHRINAASSYTGATSVQGETTIVGVNAPAGADGAFGNATSAVSVGNLTTTLATALYAADGVSVGRALSIAANNTGGVRVGAMDNSTAVYSGVMTLNRNETGLYAGANSSVAFSNNIVNGTGSAISDGTIVPKIVKQGDGIVALSGINTFTGGTTVEAGRLRALSNQSLGVTGSVQVTGGVLEIGQGVALSNTNLQLNGGRLEVNGSASGLSFQAGTLAGSGSVNAAVALDAAGKTVSPGKGNTPGVLTIAGNQTWTAFTYEWQVNDLAAMADLATSADRLNVNGMLNLDGSYELQLLSLTQANQPGDAANYDGGTRTWTVLTASGGITGFDVADWLLDDSQFGFANGEAGTFSLSQEGNALMLTLTAVPEPSALALVGIGLGAALRYRPRRRRGGER